MATDYNATLEQREITLRIALHGIVYNLSTKTIDMVRSPGAVFVELHDISQLRRFDHIITLYS